MIIFTQNVLAEDTISFSCKYKPTGVENAKLSEFSLKFTDFPTKYIVDGGAYINAYKEMNDFITLEYVKSNANNWNNCCNSKRNDNINSCCNGKRC